MCNRDVLVIIPNLENVLTTRNLDLGTRVRTLCGAMQGEALSIGPTAPSRVQA